MNGLQELSEIIKSHGSLSKIQTLYEFIKVNSDELLNVETIAYFINRAKGV
ncbi:MAG: hypothetical protein AB8B66_04595 [Rickettsiaceae bacterium]